MTPIDRTNKPLKFATQASYLVAVKYWIGWLVEEGWLETDPAEKLQLPRRSTVCRQQMPKGAGSRLGTVYLEEKRGAKYRMKKANLRSVRKLARVEAGGIEPPSRDASTMASTCVVWLLVSRRTFRSSRRYLTGSGAH